MKQDQVLKSIVRVHIAELCLLDIQPSQFYLSQEKIDRIKLWFDPNDLSNFEPLPIKLLNGKVIFTDGHTRAWVAYKAGLTKVPLVWDEDDLPWDLYQNCVDACLARNVYTVADLSERLLPPDEYKEKWLGWCKQMHEKAQGNL